MKATIYTDGAARGNPGPAGIGIVIKKGHETLLEAAAYIGKTTNNVAEYLALIRGLEEALLLRAEEVEVFADSELLVKQINGEYKVKNEGLIPLSHHARSLVAKFKRFSITHKAREENKRADALANRGIDEHSLKDAPLFGKI
ncbi:ribonuclease HI family protein [Candidatus Saganbacteria bacterium]|uniref:Ribonuclease HI family protein n=1 Tax=Candidatus Saganbacteria bacterium TaxID=2575572 RepID=A0A9D6UKG1_UNCSA|nr:ribonuclease HI family protein [Candidatus Saganbacteria bacterium]